MSRCHAAVLEKFVEYISSIVYRTEERRQQCKDSTEQHLIVNSHVVEAILVTYSKQPKIVWEEDRADTSRLDVFSLLTLSESNINFSTIVRPNRALHRRRLYTCMETLRAGTGRSHSCTSDHGSEVRIENWVSLP